MDHVTVVPQSLYRRAISQLTVALLYVLFAKIGLLLAFSHANVTGVWPPTGFALAVILLGGYRLGFGVFAGAFITNIILFYPEQSGLGYAIVPSFTIGLGNTLEAVLGVFVIRKLSQSDDPLMNLRGAAIFVVIVSLFASVISASVGVVTLYGFNFAPFKMLGELWWTWWFGDVVGALTVTPFLVALMGFRPQQYSTGKVLELLLLTTMSFGVGALAFGCLLNDSAVKFPFVVLFIPLLIWSGVRLGHFGSSILIIVLCAMGVIGTLHGVGHFARENLVESLILLQSFVCVIAGCSLLLTAAMTEFRHLRQRLITDNQALEERVAERMTEIASAETALSKEIQEKNNALIEKDKQVFLLHEMGKMGKVGAWEYDVINETLYWTDEVYRIHDVTEMPSVKDAINYYSDESRPVIEEAFMHLMESGKAYEFELQIKTGKGQLVWVRTNGFARYEEGRIVSVVGIFQDIDGAKRLEEDRDRLSEVLSQAQKMEAIGTLAGGIAHDFNNILTAIIGNSQLTLGNESLDEKGQESVHHILEASERARRLVQQILSFSRKGESVRTAVQLPLIIAEVLDLLEATFPSSIDIQMQIDKNCGRVLAASTQMHQVILNLCTNAGFELRGSGGLIRITLEQRPVAAEAAAEMSVAAGDYAVLSVEDNGSGMDEETQMRIFEPFYTTKATGEGTGMGLSVVHGIITDYNGAITVNSGINKGTTFSIFLPICTEEAAPESSFSMKAYSKAIEGKPALLFVDDEEILLDIAKEVLGDKGYEVIVCNSGEKALEIFNQDPQRFDILLTDQTMPQMSGDELIRQVRELRSDMRTVIMSGFSYVLDEQQALDMGVRAYLQKPYRHEELFAIIEQALEADH